LLAKGDVEGHIVWKRIVRATVELQKRGAGEAGELNQDLRWGWRSDTLIIATGGQL
jgi:hypothetical protein